MSVPAPGQAEDKTSSSVTWGPVVAVGFPSYNPGTAHFSQIYLRAMLLPSSDFVFVLINAGAAF